MIDWNRVAELRAEVGEDAFGEVLELFLEEVDEVMERLRTAPDPARLPDDLHFVRGSALNLGLERFCALCKRLEHDASCGQAADLAALIACYGESKAALLDRAGPGQRVA